MKKALLLVAVLLVSVFTTACINNLAVQELNTKAKDFMEKGEYQSAIERLKSSLDLDSSIFETHYNLAVAYTQNEDYELAIQAYEDAIKLKPEFKESYYSLAICEENFAKDIISGAIKLEDNGEFVKVALDEIKKEEKFSNKTNEIIADLLEKAIKNYEIYLESLTDKNVQDDILTKITELEGLLEQYKAVEQ